MSSSFCHSNILFDPFRPFQTNLQCLVPLKTQNTSSSKGDETKLTVLQADDVKDISMIPLQIAMLPSQLTIAVSGFRFSRPFSPLHFFRIIDIGCLTNCTSFPGSIGLKDHFCLV